MKRIIISIIASVLLCTGTAMAWCESGHWLVSKSRNGYLLMLEDGSVWQVNSADAVYARTWLLSDNIMVCDFGLVNVDDNSQVLAIRIK